MAVWDVQEDDEPADEEFKGVVEDVPCRVCRDPLVELADLEDGAHFFCEEFNPNELDEGGESGC